MFRRIPRVKQHDATDCGAACLLSVARSFGLMLPLARIRQYASTDERGTSILGLLDAARAMGLEARGVRASAEVLPSIPLPAIAHVTLPDGLRHFVVLYGCRGKRLTLMDPTDGRTRRMSIDSFVERWTGVLVLLSPGDRFEARTENASVVDRFWRLIRPHRAVLVQALAGAVAYTILGLSTAIYVRLIVDHVLVDGNRNLLNLLSLAMVGLVCAQAFFGTMKSLLALRTGQQLDAALILGYHRHLLALPQRFFDTMRTGEIISRVGDAVKIRAFINEASLELAVSGLVVVLSFVLMFAYDWMLAIVTASVIPLYGVVLWISNRINRRVLRQLMERAAALENQLVESIRSAATVKRFSLERWIDERLERRFIPLLKSIHEAGLSSIFTANSTEFISRGMVIVLFWVGTSFVLRSRMTPGELLGCYALLGYLTGPATRLVGANRVMQDALIAADRLFEIMDLERERDQRSEGALLPVPRGDICFEQVSFRYGARRYVLSGLDLTIGSGRLTAVVGASGCGKSTVLAILQGLHTIESGRITIGGTDLRHLDLESVRRSVSAVPQDVHLFSASLLENIAVGEERPDINRVLRVCRDLGMVDLIQALPDGLATRVGEGGMELSSGQRQRIGLARAVYRDPIVLLLDEATSNLDAMAEEEVHRCLTSLRERGTTIILVAHRLASVVRADSIAVLDGGRVIEAGTHGELLARGGAYARFWSLQHPSPHCGSGSSE